MQRHSIMGGNAAQDPEATAVYPSTPQAYPSASGTPARAQSTPQAYPSAGASYQVQSTAQQEVVPVTRERRPVPVMGIVLGILAVVALVLLGFVIFVFTRGYEGQRAGRIRPPPRRARRPRRRRAPRRMSP